VSGYFLTLIARIMQVFILFGEMFFGIMYIKGLFFVIRLPV